MSLHQRRSARFRRTSAEEWVCTRLDLGKRPILWACRPAERPAWNARHSRVLRFWSDDAGLDDDAVALLRDPAALPDLAPPPREWVDQLRVEREQSWHHLDRVLHGYEDRRYGRRREAADAEDELWRAAEGFREIETALRGAPG